VYVSDVAPAMGAYGPLIDTDSFHWKVTFADAGVTVPFVSIWPTCGVPVIAPIPVMGVPTYVNWSASEFADVPKGVVT
jgi:hypothetical protein